MTPPRKKKKSSKSAVSKYAEITIGFLLWGNLPIGRAQDTPESVGDITIVAPESIDQLNSLPRGQISEYVLANESPEIHARDILNKKSPFKVCFLKDSGISRGRVCDINGYKYYMKYATPDLNYRFQEAYNLLFLKNVLKIETPDFGYLKDSSLYFATLAMKDFVQAKKYADSLDFRANIVANIKEEGVAKLAVAKTLIPDLAKLDNWGFVQGKGLAIIDADGGLNNKGKSMMPTNNSEYFKMAGKSMRLKREKHPGELGLALSKNNIIEMKKIYEGLLTAELPNVDSSVNLNPEMFKALIQKYIISCDSVLSTISPSVDSNLPMESNNLSFKNIFTTLAAEVSPVEISSARTSSFFKPVADVGKAIGSLATAEVGKYVQASITAGAGAMLKQLNPTPPALNIMAPKLALPSQLMQKSPTEVNDLITPMVVLGTGVAIGAAALVYCVWKYCASKKVQNVSPREHPRVINKTLPQTDTTIEIRSPSSKRNR